MRIAAEWAHIPMGVMADELGLSRETISNYMGGRTKPTRTVMIVWAMRCGVPLEWLLNGGDSAPPSPPGPVTPRYPRILLAA